MELAEFKEQLQLLTAPENGRAEYEKYVSTVELSCDDYSLDYVIDSLDYVIDSLDLDLKFGLYRLPNMRYNHIQSLAVGMLLASQGMAALLVKPQVTPQALNVLRHGPVILCGEPDAVARAIRYLVKANVDKIPDLAKKCAARQSITTGALRVMGGMHGVYGTLYTGYNA